ncbi:hypothetical protein [Naasia lichenicola]|uniref:Uncharacterized protein n=1 Tax=Naasia lichenicola TaxID=2565933 RepID=A0A4S4FHT2_9MICO|nr:hypothetical protein [Naasia lichenicola]THG28695.1 hypothetical protein E6C64_18085 [Naasia lichenicola]
MTLWNEQRERQGTAYAQSAPPASRREARDAERQAAVDQRETDGALGQHPSEIYDVNASGNIWDTISRKAASQLSDVASDAERRTGRSVSDTDYPSEPLSYLTQGRPSVPSYSVENTRRPRGSSMLVDGPQGASDQGNRSAQQPVAPQRNAAAEITGEPYGRRSHAAPAAPEPESSAPTEHTLSRRELRQIRETGQVGPFSAAQLSPQVSQPPAPPWQSEPQRSAAGQQVPLRPAPAAFSAAPAPQQSPNPYSSGGYVPFEETATVEMSAIEKRALSADLPAPTLPKPPFARPTVQFPGQAQRQAESQQHDFDEVAPRTVPVNVMRSTPPAQAPAPVRPQAAAPAPAQPFYEPQAYQAPDPEQYGDQQYGQQFGQPAYGKSEAALQGFEAMIQQAGGPREAPQPPMPQRQPQPVRSERPFTPPTGHWSTQVDDHDDHLPFDGLLSRDVGSTGSSGNALIMSNDPQPDLFNALNSTGEIMATGQLDLPRSLSSTGASDMYDSAEIDRIFEDQDHQTSDVVPVRAARAVATHTSTRSVVSPRKRRGGMLPTVLAITAAVMAVGVIALLFGSYVLRLF